METENVIAQTGMQVYVASLMAMKEDMATFRSDLGAAFDAIDDAGLLRLIRVAYHDGEHVTDMTGRIDACQSAIKRALSGGALDFAQRLAAMEEGAP
ncbi:hypothetical protein SAMN05428982_2760 [Pseudoxanthomonas sp. CF385]|uniref:hypothetical protein n=1 Tax=Pseudoxanthomonas sp. CF385 TaxID=1881042 RepID=UPI00088347CC|nr:hypothetical protein [Pseudoxanthomonas sp. CF385]SDQ98727.1 hypothetical protein SAMN05428982_2760 [Pseudoxanthomonas sp. CF385]